MGDNHNSVTGGGELDKTELNRLVNSIQVHGKFIALTIHVKGGLRQRRLGNRYELKRVKFSPWCDQYGRTRDPDR